MKSNKIQIEMGSSYKCGMDEVVGLEAAMRAAFKPAVDHCNEMDTWSGNGWFKVHPVEYKSRDGFIAHSHNCGGIAIGAVIPKCGESDFTCLEFGECDECGNAETYPDGDHQCGYAGTECSAESEGYLDAYLRIWFKFEGINNDGDLEFYINASGGNHDAPYFRVKYLADIFEASFTAKSVAGIRRAANKHIKALIDTLK